MQEMDGGLLMEVHFLKINFISRGNLITINGILKFLQEMHVTSKNINRTTNAAI